jgi:hypothetical protein
MNRELNQIPTRDLNKKSTLRSTLSTLIFMILLLSGSSGCIGRDRVVAEEERGNIEGARLRLERGLDFMEKAYSADRRRDAYAFFNLAIDNFNRASELYLKELLKTPEANRPVLNEQVSKVDRLLQKCYADRPNLED